MTTAKTYKAILELFEAKTRQLEELQTERSALETQVLEAEDELLGCNDCGSYGELDRKAEVILCLECGTSWGFREKEETDDR